MQVTADNISPKMENLFNLIYSEYKLYDFGDTEDVVREILEVVFDNILRSYKFDTPVDYQSTFTEACGTLITELEADEYAELLTFMEDLVPLVIKLIREVAVNYQDMFMENEKIKIIEFSIITGIVMEEHPFNWLEKTKKELI